MLTLQFYLMILDTEDEKQKFEQIYHKYSPIMHKIAYSILKDQYEAEDAMHNAFLKIMNHLEKINDISTHKHHPYVVAIIESCSFDILRKRGRATFYPIEDVENQESTEDTFIDHIENTDNYNRVVQIIHSLEYPYKDILYFKFMCSMTSQEIGEALDMKADNVRWHLRKAKKLLSQKIVEDGVIL